MRNRSRRVVVASVVVGILLLWANRLGLLNPLKAVVGFVTTPIGRTFAGAGTGVGEFFGAVGQIRTLSSDNADLERQVASLQRQISDDTELRRENESLKRQLNFGTTPVDKLLPARVASYQPDNLRQFITIDRGTRDGIREGLAVVSEGYLVGKIIEVLPTSSRVFLVTDPAFRVNAVDQVTRASGTVHGKIGSGLVMDKIAQSDKIAQGEQIITSGLGGDLPRGLLIGQVETVDNRDNAVFQSAQVSSILRFSRLETLFVVLGI
jgi:rod shape-determining protein MreC